MESSGFVFSLRLPVTKKPAETRMGKGKGSPEYWAAKVQPGRIIYEMNGVTLEQAKRPFDWLLTSCPLKTKIIVRD